MEPFITLTATAVPLPLANVNTDQIFPARFIRKPRSEDYAQFTFHDLRRTADSALRTDIALNDARFAGARILVAGANFGCGSSREGAVYTLMDAGFRAVIAPSFGDIFASNALKNGLPCITLPPTAIESLQQSLLHGNGAEMTVDLTGQTVTYPSGHTEAFAIDAFQRDCLMKGVNEIDLSLEHTDALDAFEERDRAARPWLS